MKRLSVVCGVCGGIILYIPICFAGYLPLMVDIGDSKIYLLEACMLMSGLIAAFSISYKVSSIKHALLRTGIMFSTLLAAFVVSVQIGAVEYLDKLLHIGERNSENMAPGMAMVTVLCVALFASTITNIIIPIWKVISRKIRAKR